MLNKAGILREMSGFPYDKSKYWISTGAALVLHGVKEFTRDIDIGCESCIAEELKKSGCKTDIFPDGGIKICYNEYIEVYENWSRGDVVVIDSLPVLSLESIIKIKEKLGREKDFKDINLIREYIEKSGREN